MTSLLVLVLLTVASSSHQDPIPQTRKGTRYSNPIVPGVEHITTEPDLSSFHLHVQGCKELDLETMENICHPAMPYWYDQYQSSGLPDQRQTQLYQEYINVQNMIEAIYGNTYRKWDVVHISKDENGGEVLKTTTEFSLKTKIQVFTRSSDKFVIPTIVVCKDPQPLN